MISKTRESKTGRASKIRPKRGARRRTKVGKKTQGYHRSSFVLSGKASLKIIRSGKMNRLDPKITLSQTIAPKLCENIARANAQIADPKGIAEKIQLTILLGFFKTT